MSASTVQRSQFTREPGEFGEVGELGSLPTSRVVRTNLLPGELRASLPPLTRVQTGPVAVLTRLFGPMLTVANPLWSGDPVPRLRSLQKIYLSHAMDLSQDQRTPYLKAISVVDHAVQLRLRWQQMRETEHDLVSGNQAQPIADGAVELAMDRPTESESTRSHSLRRAIVYDDKVAALGLIWGHLNSAQYEQAASLARVSMDLWPDDQHLRFALALAMVELGQPHDAATRDFLLNTEARESATLVLRRSRAIP